MKIEKNQTSKDDKRLSRVILIAESDSDKELLEDLIDYIKYKEEVDKQA